MRAGQLDLPSFAGVSAKWLAQRITVITFVLSLRRALLEYD